MSAYELDYVGLAGRTCQCTTRTVRQFTGTDAKKSAEGHIAIETVSVPAESR